jgi:hypothetical protein
MLLARLCASTRAQTILAVRVTASPLNATVRRHARLEIGAALSDPATIRRSLTSLHVLVIWVIYLCCHKQSCWTRDPINIFGFFSRDAELSSHPKIPHVATSVNKQQEFHFEGHRSAYIHKICLLDLSPVVYDKLTM